MVGWIQDHLEAIYGIRCQARVAEYLLDEKVAQALGGTGRSDEELLVKEEEGELFVGLYLATEVLQRMEGFQPASATAMLDQELSAYCQVAEGVSHFLYLAHSAGQGRKVSLLELEAQAEVDKFATCVLHRWRGDDAACWAKELHVRLFQRVSYSPKLSEDEAWRYREANRISSAYCLRLIPHVEDRRMDKLLADLRYMYRLGAHAKMSHLSRAA
jgi:hypothetical protein